MTREGRVVSAVERQLNARGRYFINNYAEGHTNSGVPDIVSVDADGKFLAIECKASSNEPTFTQYDHGLRLLKSGCRFIVAYEDFDIDAIDRGELQKLLYQKNAKIWCVLSQSTRSIPRNIVWSNYVKKLS